MWYCISFRIFQSMHLLMRWLVSLFVALHCTVITLVANSFSHTRKTSLCSSQAQGGFWSRSHSRLARKHINASCVLRDGTHHPVRPAQFNECPARNGCPLWALQVRDICLRQIHSDEEDQGTRNAASDGGSNRSIVYLVTRIWQPTHHCQWLWEWWALNETFW